MRRDIVHPGAGNLSYAIREIVAVARDLRDLGVEITWENIGDPVQKGDRAPEWIQQIASEMAADPKTWSYADSAGIPETRAFVAEMVNRRGGARITPEDVLFFNGLGDAVSKVYGFLRREARVLGPSPAYSTHSSAEAAHSGYEHLTYDLLPEEGWMPDIDDIRNKVKYNDSIAGILLLSPDNPTGAVYPRALLEEIAEIARRYDLFLIADEIYAHVVYNERSHLHMSEWIGDVPGIAMRGISKEYPWPGSRCGWIEVLNRGRDANFAAYAESLVAAKRMEVSSTTLPQATIPPVFSDPRYATHIASKEAEYARRAAEAARELEDCEHIIAIPPQGAFYYTVMFKPGVLNDEQTLPIEGQTVREKIEHLARGAKRDMRFVHYLMGSTGIVVVPLSGFHCRHDGFRFTLLESDPAKRAWIYRTLRESIDAYVASAPEPGSGALRSAETAGRTARVG